MSLEKLKFIFCHLTLFWIETKTQLKLLVLYFLNLWHGTSYKNEHNTFHKNSVLSLLLKKKTCFCPTFCNLFFRLLIQKYTLLYNLKIVGALHQILCPRELNYVSRSPHTTGAATTNTCLLTTRKILLLLSIAIYKQFYRLSSKTFPIPLNTKENFKLNK